MHFIIVGCGRVGSSLAMQLSDDGHSVAVIDKSRDAFQRLNHFNGQTILGSGFDREVMTKADASRAYALAAVTRGDNTNILCARIARDNFGVKNVVARIYDAQRASIYMKLGIPTVASAMWTTQQVKRWVLPDDDSIAWSDGTDTLRLVERVVPDHLAGKRLSDLHFGTNVRLAGIIRGGLGRVDVENLFAQEDDVLEFLVTPQGLNDLTDQLQVPA